VVLGNKGGICLFYYEFLHFLIKPTIFSRILEKHAAITNKGGKFTIEKFNDAKVLRNGAPLTSVSDLNHLDRLVFGTSLYYTFWEPSKVKPNDPYYDFQAMQDEIGKNSGIISKDNKNMSQAQIQSQTELMDLLPAIEEANMISIAMDKRIMFTALSVSPEARYLIQKIPFIFV
jgi:hypothetical protein